MALCPACEHVNIPNLVGELEVVPGWWERVSSQSKPRGMVHLLDATQLPRSAAGGCSLCGMIIDAVAQYGSSSSSPPGSARPSPSQNKRDIAHIRDHLIKSPIYLRPNYDPVKPAFPDEDVANAWHVRGFKALVPVDHGILTGQIRLFAPHGSPAAVSCDVIGRPALSSSDSPQAYDLVNRWMRCCLSKHEACKETFSGSIIDESVPPELPTRVIHIGCPDSGISPRLIETDHQTSRYVALSHCWGTPALKQTLVTTHATLKSHLAGIAWEAIPRTYQDAISATRRLGLEYIWIDSLCIIQDSHSDWLRESERMGTVYENAHLTIAASHASDCGQPCFFTRSKPPPSIELHHLSRTGKREGSIFASLTPINYVPISPDHGPLAFRAWATQEWLLSRRMIFYTADCLVWSCKMISQRELGASFHSTTRNPRWKIIVEKYSARLLTMATDRLIALEGLRIEMGKKRPNDVYCLGLWKNSMPDQLLWYCLEPAERAKSPLGLPTWTWASSMHGVRFLSINDAKAACDAFRFDEGSKTLTIRGAVKQALRLRPHVAPLPEASAMSDTSPNLICIPPDTPHANMIHDLLAHDGTVVGWVVLDDNEAAISGQTCLRVMSRRISEFSKDGFKTKMFREWILVLRPSDGDSNEYQRVGVGIITTMKPFFDEQMTTQVVVR